MTVGFGEFDASCPDAGEHEWASASVDPLRRCLHCGMLGRGHVVDRDGEVTQGFLTQATAARSAFFSGLRAPESAHGKKPKEGS